MVHNKTWYDYWVSICDDLLGATAVGGGFFTSELLAVVTNFSCNGSEHRLYQCPFNQIMSGAKCIHDAAVICQGKGKEYCILICRLISCACFQQILVW